jgi:hypothetical protein
LDVIAAPGQLKRSTAFVQRKMKYEEIARLNPVQMDLAISRNEPDELSRAVLSAALYADDSQWAEDICVRLAGHENAIVRGNAVLGFGHLARIKGNLTESRVRPLIEDALRDENTFVRDHAESAADDVESFLRWQINRSP